MTDPALRSHLRAIDETNEADADWQAHEDARYEAIMSLCDAVASHCVSAREASWRRERELLERHLGAAKEALKLALQTFNQLPKA